MGGLPMTSSAGVAQRRGWYYGWNIVGACILAEIAASALPANAFSLFLHDWSTQLNCSISTLQLGIGAFAFIVPLLSPFSGVLADKYPARLLFGIGLVVIALFCVAMSYITAAWQMVALFALLLPIGTSFSTLIPANAVVSRWFVKRLGLALGLTAFGLAIGGVVLPPIVAMIMPTLGWRMIWRIGGLGIGAFVVPTVVYVLRDRPTEREGFHYLTGEGAAVPHHGQQGEKGAGLNWRDILKRRNFWLLLAIYLPMLFVYGGSLQNLAPIAISHGLNQQEAGALVSVFNAAHIVATLVMGMLSDRFGNRLPLLGLALVCAT
ncbi:MAG: MFS transporter, partial [Rhodospirillaceae bacterium]